MTPEDLVRKAVYDGVVKNGIDAQKATKAADQAVQRCREHKIPKKGVVALIGEEITMAVKVK